MLRQFVSTSPLVDNTHPPTIRPITDTDSEALWRIRNSEGVRATSHTSSVIPRANHDAWFVKYRANPNNLCWVVVVNDEVAGYCRVDEALVSIAVDERFKGQGLGKLLLAEAVNQSKSRWPIIKAEVQTDNIASIKLFEKVGFHQTEVVKGYIHLEFHAA